MEKNEELLERLVNEIAAQNKLIALLIAREIGRNFDDTNFLSVEDYMLLCSKRAYTILEKSYSLEE